MPFYKNANLIDVGGGGGGNGDMTKAVYDTNNDGIVDKVDTLPTDNLLDGEMLRYNQSLDIVEGTGVIDNETETNFGEKTVKAGTGTFALGESQAMSASVDNVVFTDLLTDTSRGSVDAVIGSNVPETRLYGQLQTDVVQSAANTETLTNPTWPISISGNASLIDASFDFQAALTNVRIALFRNGVEAWSYRFDVTSTGFQVVELQVPLQVKNDGATYTAALTSIDGDVLVGGESGVPQWSASYQAYDDTAMQTLPDGTGVKFGGELSAGTGLSINVEGGYGYRIDATGDVTTAQYIEWLTATDWALPTTADGIYAIYIDNPNSIAQISIANIDGAFNRDYLILGSVRIDGGVITAVRTLKTDVNEMSQQFFDLLRCLGTIRCGGMDLAPTTGLQFQINGGTLLARGAGSETGSRLQNTLIVDAVATAVFDTMVGTALPANYFDALGVSNLDFSQYDSGGGVLAPVANNNYTIQYVYKAPVNAGGVVVMYGQEVYNTIDDALNAASTEETTVPQFIVDNYLLLGRIVGQSNGTDITNPTQFRFLAGAKFGASLSGGSLGSSASGGDVLGAGGSSTNEVATYADISGKVLSAASNITMQGSVIQQTNGNVDLSIETTGNGDIVLRANSKPQSLKVDSLTDTNSEIVIQTQGTDRFRVKYDTPTRTAQLADATNNIGLYHKTDTNVASLGGTAAPTAPYALKIDSITGVLGVPIVNDTVELSFTALLDNDAVWYNSDRKQLRSLKDTTPLDISRQAISYSPPSQLTQALDFTEDKTRYIIAMTNATTFTVTANPRTLNGVLLELSGNFAPTFPATFYKQQGSLDYDGSGGKVNYITIICISPTRFNYVITRDA